MRIGIGGLHHETNSFSNIPITKALLCDRALVGESIVNTMTEVGQQSATVREAVENIAYLAALIAVNLSVMNLLPIPALDGGKIFFLMINQLSLLLFRKQIPAKFENYIHVAGFILLMGLMAFVMFQDVWKLFQ